METKFLSQHDVNWAVKNLPSKLTKALEQSGNMFVIAGGYLRYTIAKEPASDIDIFVSSNSQMVRCWEVAVALAKELEPDTAKHFITQNCITIHVQGRIIQLITRWVFDTPAAILNHFDFTVCQAGIYYEKHNTYGKWVGICGEDFYSDLAAKRTVYTYPADAEPGGSLLRLLKYRAKGYSPTLGSVSAIVGRLTGADEQAILANLREVDPLLVDKSEPAEKELTVKLAVDTYNVSRAPVSN